MYWFCNQSNELSFKAAMQHTKFAWIFTPIYSLNKLTRESQRQSADLSKHLMENWVVYDGHRLWLLSFRLWF